MRARPIFRIGEASHAEIGAVHTQGQKEALAHRSGVRPLSCLLQYLGHSVKGDILIGVTRTGLTLQRRAGQTGTQRARVLPILQPFVKSVFGEAGLLGKQLLDAQTRFGTIG